MTDTTTSPKYDVLVADPPWDIEQKGKKRGAEKHYNLMSLQDIKDMSDAIKSATADDSHCWLWVTMPPSATATMCWKRGAIRLAAS